MPTLKQNREHIYKLGNGVVAIGNPTYSQLAEIERKLKVLLPDEVVIKYKHRTLIATIPPRFRNEFHNGQFFIVSDILNTAQLHLWLKAATGDQLPADWTPGRKEKSK